MFSVADPMYVPISMQHGARAVVLAQVVARIAVWGIAGSNEKGDWTAEAVRGKRVATQVRPMTAYVYAVESIRNILRALAAHCGPCNARSMIWPAIPPLRRRSPRNISIRSSRPSCAPPSIACSPRASSLAPSRSPSRPGIPAVALLLAWQAWTSTFPEHEFFLGSPGGIWREGLAMADSGKLGRAFVVTLMEAVAGFAAGTLLGSATGLLVWLSPAIQRAARYHLAILGSIPLFALGPVFVFWLGTGMSSKIVLSFIACFIVCAAQASAGTAEVSRGSAAAGTALWPDASRTVATDRRTGSVRLGVGGTAAQRRHGHSRRGGRRVHRRARRPGPSDRRRGRLIQRQSDLGGHRRRQPGRPDPACGRYTHRAPRFSVEATSH